MAQRPTGERVIITRHTLARAARLAREGKTFEFRDAQFKRLSIRVRSGSATWTLRLRVGDKQTTLPIGRIELFGDPDVVRKLAARGKAMGAEGQNPKALFEAAQREGSGSLSAAEAEQARAAGTVWTWEQLREKFLDDTKANRRHATLVAYRSVLRLPDFDRMNGRLITQLDATDLRAVRDAMVERGVVTQSKAAVRTAKAAFSWAVENGNSGLLINPMRDVKQLSRSTSLRPEDEEGEDDDQSGQPLSDLQLGCLFSEIDNCSNQAAKILCAFMLLTLQRRLTTASAEKAKFKMDAETGLLVWEIRGSRMKGGRPHEIPLTDTASTVYENALRISRPNSKFLFPQQRPYRKGQQADSHIAPGAVNRILTAIQQPGCRLAPGPEVGNRISPHDFRASFTTFMVETHRTPDQDLAKILAHSEGRGRNVTTRHYNRARELELKLELLKKWEAHIKDLMAKYAPADFAQAAE